VTGEATGSDGKKYLLETDMRAFKGTYKDANGMERTGTFAFVWIDLYEPGTGSPPKQAHDLIGGVPASGLFWTVQLPDDALTISSDGKQATLKAKDLPVVDTFQFGGPNVVPAITSFEIKWTASGPKETRGSGKSVGADNPAAFSGEFYPAKATGTFSVTEPGFTFKSEAGADTDDGFATLGTEKNGSSL
jgi:hypothetical protein